ncbi:MAG: response regulator [Chlorobi bacterium]|nr:response regulator [Chlorobiota bacterium]
MSGKNAFIYVVDDDQFIRELVKKNLIREGFDVEAFSYGEDCLEALENKKPDLIILDYLFMKTDGAVMNGKEVFHRIREIHPDMPVIMLSGQDSGGVVLELARLGINDYIIKDKNLGESLLRAINDVLDTEEE